MFAGVYEDCMGLPSVAGEGSSRAYYVKKASVDTYDHDDTFEFKFLSKGLTYTDTQITEGGSIKTSIVFHGATLDMLVEYYNKGFYEIETYIDVFRDDPINWVINNTDLAEPLRVCEGYLTFSTGNMSFNPHKVGDDILIQTVSGKSYTIRKHIIALTSEIDKVVQALEVITDERIGYYKAKKVDEWNKLVNP